MAAGDSFSKVGQVRLSATGAGEVTLSPPGSEGGWTVTLTSVSVSTRVAEPTFRLYRDNVAASNFLEGSYSGAQDSTDTVHRVQPGQSLIGVWEGGDPGALATLRVSGETGA